MSQDVRIALDVKVSLLILWRLRLQLVCVEIVSCSIVCEMYHVDLTAGKW